MMSRRQLILAGAGVLTATFKARTESRSGEPAENRARLVADTKAALSQLDVDSLVQLSMDLCNIENPLGFEEPIGQFLCDRMHEEGLVARLQQFAPSRSNVVGSLIGEGGGRSLMLTGHLESGVAPQRIEGVFPKARVYGDWMLGVGIWNMKGVLASYLAAVSAVRRANILLSGDVHIAGVAGTHDQTIVNSRIKGDGIQGYSIGTMHLLAQGLTADLCVVGEPTSFRIVRQHFGVTAVRIDTVVQDGGQFLEDLTDFAWPSVDAVEHAADIVQELRPWISEYKKRNTIEGISPWVSISAIEGGAPWSPYPAMASTIYVFVGTPPHAKPTSVLEEIRGILVSMRGKNPHLRSKAEIYFRERGPFVPENSPVVSALRAAHESVFGTNAKTAVVPWHSDAVPLTQFGIESVNYGPAGRAGPSPDGKGWSEAVRVADLVNCARVYAELIVRVCSAPVAHP